MEDFFQVGIITSTHGLRGEVKVYPTTDDVRRFRRLKEVIPGAVRDSEEVGHVPRKPGETLEIEEVKF